MVMEPQIFDYIAGDEVPFEDYPLKTLVKNKELSYYIHKGYWQCMDTLNERNKLEELWINGKAPWKIWND